MGTIDNVKSTAKLNRTQFFWKPRSKGNETEQWNMF